MAAAGPAIAATAAIAIAATAAMAAVAQANMHTKQLVGILAVILVLTGGAFLLQDKIPFVGSGNAEKISQMNIAGNYDELLVSAREMAEVARSQEEYNDAKAAESYGLYMSGVTDSQLQAARLAKQRYIENPGHPIEQAHAINQLLAYMMSSKKTSIIEEVFAGEPFQDLYKKDDLPGSISRLAEKSLSLEPSVDAAAYALLQYWGPLINWDKKYTWETGEARPNVLRIVYSGMKRLDAAYQSGARSDDPEAQLVAPFHYYYWKGYLYGIAARYNDTWMDESVENYELMFKYFSETKGADGKPVPSLEILVPRYHISYALMLITVGGEAKYDDARMHIEEAMQMLAANPKLHERGYVAYLKGLGKGESSTATSGLKSLAKISKVHPPFKEFLKQYGVVLK